MNQSKCLEMVVSEYRHCVVIYIFLVLWDHGLNVDNFFIAADEQPYKRFLRLIVNKLINMCSITIVYC